MTVPTVLLPVFALVLLAFLLLIATAGARRAVLVKREVRLKDIALGEPNWPARVTQYGNAFRNQFEAPVLFYVLVALALPLRKTDLVFVLLSWVFVVSRYAHAAIFVTSNNVQRRFLAYVAGIVVLLILWVWFSARILLGF